MLSVSQEVYFMSVIYYKIVGEAAPHLPCLALNAATGSYATKSDCTKSLTLKLCSFPKTYVSKIKGEKR